MTAPVLVIGYGNPLRRDDGAGPAVAGRFAGRPGVDVRTPHQLVPELAEAVSAAGRVVFVDAAAAGHEVEARPVRPRSAGACLGHVGDPGWLLGLAAEAFGRAPPAWLVTVPARDLGYGDGFAPETRADVDAAVGVVEGLCRAG